jgi:cytochrome P450
VAPVYQCGIERLGRPWILTRYDDDATLVRDPALIKDGRLIAMSGLGEEGPYIETLRGMFAFIAPPRHTRLRSLVNRGFTPRSIRALEPRLQRLVDSLIDEREASGEMDLIADYAFRIPATVICWLLGCPVEDIPQIEDWARDFSRRADEGSSLTPEMEKRGDEVAVAFMDYLRELIARRRRQAEDDLISRLVEIQRDADDLSDDDIAATAILLFQAGHETTANMIGKGMLALFQHPEQLALLRQRPELIENATEELLRYDTPVQMTTKLVTKDIPFHGRTIRSGEAVTSLRGAVNRDPERYPDPDRLDITRKDIDHHSFGMGAHYCLGAALARMEIQHAVLTLVQRLPGMRLATDELVYKDQLHLHGLARLPVSW